MKILGLNAFHGDAAAALVIDGELVNAVEEERLNRVKHCAGFPGMAARWCLEDAGLTLGDVDHVAVSRDPRANLWRKALRVLRAPNVRFVRDRMANTSQVSRIAERLATACGWDPKAVVAQVHHVEHHLTHAASAFFVAPFDEAAVLSVDGFGDFASTLLAVGKGRDLRVLDRVFFPHSLGIYYSAVAQWLGFPNYGDEGKVMGLAPYGHPRFAADMRRLIQPTEDGLFRLDLDYFVHHREGVEMTWDEGSPRVGRLFSEALEDLLGPSRAPNSELKSHHEDVAASLQSVFEEVYLHVVHQLAARTGARALCLAGGVALNAVANGRIRSETPFEDLYIQPAAGDSGTAVGAAFWVWNSFLGRERSFVMDHAYTGPEFDDARVSRALTDAGLEGRRLDDSVLVEETAGHISEGKVVGWFQGRMEFGPRALGHRSIVADPRNSNMKATLNARIKHREPFRPFAPSVVSERVDEYYDDNYPSPFMILVYRTRPERCDELQAVDHVDHTGRVQTVTRSASPRYYDLLSAFARRTGIAVVLNTSFNESEPIVCTPEEAVACFNRTHMDVLVIGNIIVERLARHEES